MLSIRSTLILSFGGITLAGMLALSFGIHDRARQMLIDASVRGAQQTAHAQSERIAEWVEGNDKELALLSELDVVRDFEPKEIRPLLMRRISSRKDLSGLFYVTPTGMIWNSLAPDKTWNVSNTDYFQKLMIRGDTASFITSATKDKADGLQKVFLIRAIYTKNAETMGLLGTGLRLDRLGEIVSAGALKDSYSWLVDRNGLVLSHPNPDYILSLNILQNAKNFGFTGLEHLRKPILARETGQGEFIGPNGEKRMVVFTPVPGNSGWVFGISIPVNKLTIQANQLLQRLAYIFGLILMLMVALIWLLARRISNPIELLAQHTRRLAEGHFSERLSLPASTEHEIGELANYFNHMADSIDSMMQNLLESERTTALANAELALRRDALISSEERYQLAIEAANDILWDMDIQHGTATISSRWEALYGMPVSTPNEWIQALRALVHPDDYASAGLRLQAHLRGDTSFFQCEFRLRLKTGEMNWRLCRGQAMRNAEGEVIRLCGSLTDIHEQKESEYKIHHMAFFDSLTGLPNRWMFLERLDEALARGAGDWQGALLFMNLNRFKTLNDLYGHQEGDELLRQVAQRLDAMRPAGATFARLGGDEFVFLLPDIPGEAVLHEMTEGLLRFLRAPFVTPQREHRLTASIGIALFPHDSLDPSELMRKADMALHAAKESGRNDWRVFDPAMFARIQRKNETEQALRQALQQGEFSLHYQPQLDLTTGRICAFEALSRWTRPGIGFVSPVEFIPLAEETGLILALGDWVLKTACTQLAQWRSEGHDHLEIAINVSSLQLKKEFAERVAVILQETGVPADRLEIEITESVLMQSFTDNMATLEALRQLGVRMSLDDFGTGYSSLSYLRQLPIQTVKIDKSFVDDLTEDPVTRHIVKSIISLSHGLNLRVVAEGVETAEQLAMLQADRCEIIQGYYVDRPLTAAAAGALLNSCKTRSN